MPDNEVITGLDRFGIGYNLDYDALKKQFFEHLPEFAEQDLHVYEIAKNLGISKSTFHRLRLKFPEVEDAMRAVQEIRDGHRNMSVEDKLYNRLISGEAADGAYFQYLYNRRPDRWADRKNVPPPVTLQDNSITIKIVHVENNQQEQITLPSITVNGNGHHKEQQSE